MAGQLAAYLNDPFLYRLYDDIKKAGPIKSISMDLTHVCNIRCQGCWFFAEEMDLYKSPKDEVLFDVFVEEEKARGTNCITVTGGEPSLMQNRIKTLYDNFHLIIVSNGLRKIPYEGFEQLPIAVSVWGDHETDRVLRGSGKIDVFARALKNYKDDPRVMWYNTTTPGNAHEIESVVSQCVENGNYMFFNFYGDISSLGGNYNHWDGFEKVRAEIKKMIDLYPERILMTSYMSQVISSGRLYNETWGHDVCCSVSVDNEKNRGRINNGKLFNPHFRAYNPDLKTTRRCCVGDDRDCSNCFDTWAHMGWIMINLEQHLDSQQEFTNWLTTKYIFYLANRMVDFEAGSRLLPEIHRRTGQTTPVIT